MKNVIEAGSFPCLFFCLAIAFFLTMNLKRDRPLIIRYLLPYSYQ
ncbi:MAG: hypothetical protein VKL41_01310 [Snowella sp.]|nr:hypothetical protein [Snowella sp.]